MSGALRVLVIGCGGMGGAHARAYHADPGFEVVGLVSRTPTTRQAVAAELGESIPDFDDAVAAIAETRPDVVSVNTYPDSHHALVRAALEAGCHVFCEKPLAQTVAQAEELIMLAGERDRALLVGYILRVHPMWQRFIERGRELGRPLVMRMNLNQRSDDAMWRLHRHLMESVSPLVDCGVHYVDVMCQLTGARPTRVVAMGARLSDEIAADMYNYGNLQVHFDDGSVGWYEAGWGPMISETAYFVKDVVGPAGAVSIVHAAGDHGGDSADLEAHTRTEAIRVQYAELVDERFAREDEWITADDEPGHQELCDRQARRLHEVITDASPLTDHHRAVIDSMRVVAAADESIRTGRIVEL